MRILATGGAGYVGSAVVRALIGRGIEAWAYDNLSKGFTAAVPAGRLILGELSDQARLVEVLRQQRIDAVMHFASFIAVGESVQQPRSYYRNNIAHSLALLEAMQEAGVQRLLFSSTAAVYAPADTALTEDSPKDPASPYAFSKFALERIIHDFAAAYGLGYCILRYFNACGADPTGRFGEAHDPETHLIPLVLQVPLGQREFIGVYGDDYPTPDGTCIRDYIHVDDLADAHIRALTKVAPAAAAVYNIGTGNGNSVQEVIAAARQVTGHPIPVKIQPRRPGDTARLVASSAKIQRELGWHPQYTSIHQIIETAWKWHQSHPHGYSENKP